MGSFPAEIWTQIFDLAADEDVIFQYGLPTTMAESAWHKNGQDEWALRSPSEALNLVQRRSYKTKKAIISTCRSWREIGSELLFRCLFFNDPKKVLSLCQTLDTSGSIGSTVSSSLGWWTKRIHLIRYHALPSLDITMSDLESALMSVIQHCPNLEIFIVEWPMGSTFGPVVDTLATHAAKSLRTVHWNISREAASKVIWALDSLPHLLSAHIHFETIADDQENFHLGSASNVTLTLPFLQQLSLRGHSQEFLEQAVGWSIPCLRSFSFDFGTLRMDQPDIITFLTLHGTKLIFLDLNCIPALDVPRILELCPSLTTFSFNADWRIQQPGEEVPVPTTSNTIAFVNQTMSVLVRKPHQNITSIGLHGLMYAFGVGYAAEYATQEPLQAHVIRRSNDLNIAALNKLNFPKLQRVRALSRAMLHDLNQEDGPSEAEGGVERYDNWWSLLSGSGVRLEDCTGALLGTLPEDEDEDEEGESDEDEDEEEQQGDKWGFNIPPLPVEEGSNLTELRQLLEECRAMEEEREESMFGSMFSMGMGGMGMGGMGMGMGGMGMGGMGGMGNMGMGGIGARGSR